MTICSFSHSAFWRQEIATFDFFVRFYAFWSILEKPQENSKSSGVCILGRSNFVRFVPTRFSHLGRLIFSNVFFSKRNTIFENFDFQKHIQKIMSGIGGDANTMSTINRPTSRVLAPPGGGRLVFRLFKVSKNSKIFIFSKKVLKNVEKRNKARTFSERPNQYHSQKLPTAQTNRPVIFLVSPLSTTIRYFLNCFETFSEVR